MVDLMLSAIKAPVDIWSVIISWIQDLILNYGWTIVVFTLLIKIVLSPMDFFIKYSTRKNTLVQKKLAPELEKLNKRFANNKEMLNQQTMALYKKEGYNIIGSCVTMLLNIVVTMVIFLTIFSSLRSVSTYQVLSQYNTLSSAYTAEYERFVTDEYGIDVQTEGYELLLTSEEKTAAGQAAEAEVLKVFKKTKDSWLWVENIWSNDGAAKVFPSYSEAKTLAKNSKDESYMAMIDNITEAEYEKITGSVVSSYERWNGYYILAVLAAGTTFLSQIIADKGNGLSKKKKLKTDMPDQSAKMMKTMKILLPAMMVVFVLTSTASFGIYVVTSALIGAAISYVTNIISFKLTEKKEQEIIAVLEKEELRKMKKLGRVK